MGPRIQGLVMGGDLPLIPKIALFIVFTFVLVVMTLMLLPRLVVLGPLGYVAGFVITGLSSATVIIPGPGFGAVMVMARDLDPVVLGIAAGVGGTLGELTGYWLGSTGSESIQGNRVHAFVMKAMTKMGGSILVAFGLVPMLPVDAAGIIAGAVKYPIPKFLFYLGVGKTIMSITILYMAAQAFQWAEPYLKWLG